MKTGYRYSEILHISRYPLDRNNRKKVFPNRARLGNQSTVNLRKYEALGARYFREAAAAVREQINVFTVGTTKLLFYEIRAKKTVKTYLKTRIKNLCFVSY